MSLASLLRTCVPVALLLAGCAHMPGAQDKGKQVAGDEDPLEGFNRSIYEFNYVFDSAVLKPVATGYRAVVPEEGREAVTNVLENLYTPVVFFNSVLQGDPQNSFASLWRFMLNTTFGLGGLHDFAAEAGLKDRTTDFGQTLAMWGVEPGAYLVLPIIGPSNLRDATGRVADAFLNPFNYAESDWVPYSIWGTTAIDTRSNNMKLIDDIYRSSLDPYSTFRSGYTQKRKSDITRAKAARKKALENVCTK